MKLRKNCRALSLCRILPVCALLFAAAFACIFFGGKGFFALFGARITPVVLPWRVPADSTVSLQLAFVFEPYSTLTLEGGVGEAPQTRHEYLMTTDWQSFAGVSFAGDDLALYAPLIEEMHTAAGEGGHIEPLTLTGIWVDMDEAAQADFDELILGMGYSPQDAALSHRVLLVNQAPFVVLDSLSLALFGLACLFALAGLLLLLFNLAGGFQTSLKRHISFAGRGPGKNKIAYSTWKKGTVKCGDLYLNPDLLVFHRGVWVKCLAPSHLDAVRLEKGKYLRLFPAGGRPARVWVGKQNTGFVHGYFFERFPAVSVE